MLIEAPKGLSKINLNRLALRGHAPCGALNCMSNAITMEAVWTKFLLPHDDAFGQRGQRTHPGPF